MSESRLTSPYPIVYESMLVHGTISTASDLGRGTTTSKWGCQNGFMGVAQHVQIWLTTVNTLITGVSQHSASPKKALGT